jgi:hypothetical protein
MVISLLQDERKKIVLKKAHLGLISNMAYLIGISFTSMALIDVFVMRSRKDSLLPSLQYFNAWGVEMLIVNYRHINKIILSPKKTLQN